MILPKKRLLTKFKNINKIGGKNYENNKKK